MKKIVQILVLVGFAFSGFCQSEWPIFRGNQELTASASADLPADLRLIASFQTDDEIKASPVIKNGVIYCGSTDSWFYAFDLNGHLKWKYKAENGIEAPAVLLNGKVIFGCLDGSLICLNEKDGSLFWQYKTGNQIVGSANWKVIGGQTVLAVGSYDYYLHGVNLADGKGIWKYESNNFINGAPSLFQKSVVFGGCDGFLHVVDLQTGKVAKKIELSTYLASSPAIVGNMAYVGDYDGRFFAVDLDAGSVIWTYDNPQKDLPFIASPAIQNNWIVLGNEDRQLYVINRKDGKLVWTKRLSNRINSSSVISASSVFTATMDGMLYRHDLTTGEELWSYEIGSQIAGSPAIYDGKLVIGANDGRIYIFGTDKP
ncbi:PQQ-binding-like beta-propeller repeat protein [Mangrovibacterium sp.]|uniref:outer membrane protein assembly factor BamB family protein n=1 Tax=Mangrovibacterium sp. TaxID=1961364 RepID=UPI0035695CE2